MEGPRHAAPLFPLVRTHLNASQFVTDTETTVTVHEVGARVIVRCLPGLRYWGAPAAATVRGWVDEAAKERGLKRSGMRQEIAGGPGTWVYVYALVPLEETPDHSPKMEVAR